DVCVRILKERETNSSTIKMKYKSGNEDIKTMPISDLVDQLMPSIYTVCQDNEKYDIKAPTDFLKGLYEETISKEKDPKGKQPERFRQESEADAGPSQGAGDQWTTAQYGDSGRSQPPTKRRRIGESSSQRKLPEQTTPD